MSYLNFYGISSCLKDELEIRFDQFDIRNITPPPMTGGDAGKWS